MNLHYSEWISLVVQSDLLVQTAQVKKKKKQQNKIKTFFSGFFWVFFFALFFHL